MIPREHPLVEVPPHLRPDAKQRRVVCAANRVVYYVEGFSRHAIALGARHFDPLMRDQIESHWLAMRGSRDQWRVSEQGFIDQWGTFMDRREAFEVAKAAGQLLYGPHLSGGELDSSDLY